MRDLISVKTQFLVLPMPRTSITIRPGVLSDVPFLDSLQKLHTKQVGWMPTAQFEGKIKLGHVLIAEEARDGVGCEGVTGSEHRHTVTQSLPTLPTPVGYCIGNDQYFKRDDVGIIYQINVAPVKQRGLIGATLIKAMFDRAAWGCKLFCCWCAQDIEANWFWESLGFVPLAFRAGSAKKSRVHIFWQKRIRAGDCETPYWFPSQTTSGSIREDRIVLPIPPGTHWKDAKPIILPGEPLPVAAGQLTVVEKKPRVRALPPAGNSKPVAPSSYGMSRSKLHFDLPKLPKAPREKRKATKNDPKLVAAARELRDRWLEKVNSGQYLPQGEGKYEVCRVLPDSRMIVPGIDAVQALPAPLAA